MDWGWRDAGLDTLFCPFYGGRHCNDQLWHHIPDAAAALPGLRPDRRGGLDGLHLLRGAVRVKPGDCDAGRYAAADRLRAVLCHPPQGPGDDFSAAGHLSACGARASTTRPTTFCRASRSFLPAKAARPSRSRWPWRWALRWCAVCHCRAGMREKNEIAFPLGGRCPWPRPRTDEGKVCPTSPYTGSTRKVCPHQSPAGDSFPRGGSQKLPGSRGFPGVFFTTNYTSGSARYSLHPAKA